MAYNLYLRIDYGGPLKVAPYDRLHTYESLAQEAGARHVFGLGAPLMPKVRVRLTRFKIFCEPRLVNQASDFVYVFFDQSFADAISSYECALCLDQFSQ